ncbi:MAG TPA: hypothetical protein V6D08_18305 [Candidatus Obscuribacterales bacterium]
MFKKTLLTVGLLVVSLLILLFVPPVRNALYGSKLWPYATPWDVTPEQITELKRVVQPGDVIVERNLHSFHWMLLCLAGTGSSWVHAAIVDEDGKIVNMMVIVRKLDITSYLDKQSTDMVLVRPPYKDDASVVRALRYAKSKLGTPFDPSFDNQAGNCTGLIAGALKAGGVQVRSRPIFLLGKTVYPAAEFLRIPNARVIWRSRDRRASEQVVRAPVPSVR